MKANFSKLKKNLWGVVRSAAGQLTPTQLGGFDSHTIHKNAPEISLNLKLS